MTLLFPVERTYGTNKQTDRQTTRNP